MGVSPVSTLLAGPGRPALHDAKLLVRERNVQARRELQVIPFRSAWRIADIDIRERILPAQPLVELGDGAEIEVPRYCPRLTEVGVEERSSA